MYSTGFYPYEIGNSARFDSNSYYQRTPSSSGSRTTWTWNAWVKLGSIGQTEVLFTARTAGQSANGTIGFEAGKLFWDEYDGSSNILRRHTTQVFRDPSAWYMITIVADTTNATASNRGRIYINGSQVTDFSVSVNPAQSAVLEINQNITHRIGANSNNTQYFNGYIAEVNFIDGQALDATSFGEFKSGVWIPKSYSGSYGTNGFYLPFDDANFLGKDNSTVLGPDLVTNGSFDTDVSNWSLNGFCTTSWVSSGKMQINRTGGTGPTAYQAITCEVGETYAIRTEINSVGSRGDLAVNTAVNSGTVLNLSGTNGSTVSISGEFTATQTTHYLQFAVDNGGTSIIVDEVSVKKISSQGNDWTANNLAATDQVLDSPTNNFATMNPLEAGNGTYAEGNLKFSANTASAHQMASSTASISSGKWYAEILIQAVGGTYPHVGITPVATSNATYVGNNGYGYRSDGNKQILTSTSSYGASYTAGDIIGIAFDADSGSITFYKNGSSQGVADSSIDTSTTWRFSNSLYSTGGISIANFGQDSSFAGNKTAQGNTDANGIGDFYYAPPSGYLALCTANLPDPAIDPAQDDVPEDYFNTVLYTGTGAVQSITGVGYQPDLVWLKSRSGVFSHFLVDGVRGNTKYLISNSTGAEATATNRLTSFDSDGFALGDAGGSINGSGESIVAWNWLAGNGTSSNTDGTITSTVSANQKAGFSIVTWTGNGNSSGNVGTGLSSSIPIDMAIVKKRSATSEWQVGHRASGQGVNFAYHLELNSTSALSGSGPYMMGSQATSNAGLLFLASEGLTNGVDYIAYCFHSVEGYSKFGSYTGNGSTDGPFVYLGFRPAFVMVKRSDATGNWKLFDNALNPYNAADNSLAPNVSNPEASGSTTNLFDFTSNGFKARGTASDINASGGTYIFACFSEMPFKYSNAR
jgi:hypothetical protein